MPEPLRDPTMLSDELNHIALCDSIQCSGSQDQDSADVWKVDLDLTGERVRELEQSLSPDEAARADRFRSQLDRQRFIAARGSLRVVLAEYLHIKAVELQFAYTPGQKPVLAHPALVPEEALCFNVSHSDALALIAVTRRRAVGIDIERKRADFDPESLAKRFFAPREYAALCGVSPDEKHCAFLRYWVCKEAYLKALGTGLSRPLHEFAVSLEDYSLKLVSSTGGGKTTIPYRLYPLSPDLDYVAAIAIEAC